MVTLHVGPNGTLIDNDVMDRVLQPDVIGNSPYIHIWGASEATALLFIDQASSSHDPEFIRLHPHVIALVLPVCLGVPDKVGEWQEGHFITLLVDIRAKSVRVFDSLPGNASMTLLAAQARTLTNNVWGSRSATCVINRTLSDTQVPGSNDCAVFCFRNVCAIASTWHLLPFLGGVPMVSFDFVDRDVFRRIVSLL